MSSTKLLEEYRLFPHPDKNFFFVRGKGRALKMRLLEEYKYIVSTEAMMVFKNTPSLNVSSNEINMVVICRSIVHLLPVGSNQLAEMHSLTCSCCCGSRTCVEEYTRKTSDVPGPNYLYSHHPSTFRNSNVNR